MAALGYSPIPPNLVEDDFQAAGRLPGGTTPAAPTAANCSNPYITGALQPVGEPQQVGATNPGSDTGTGAAPTAAAAGGTAAGGHGGGGGAGATSSGAAAASGAGSSSSAATHLAPGVQKVGASQTHSLAAGAYTRVNAMDAAATAALGGWSAGEVAFWCAVFALAIIGIPLTAWYWLRRRRERQQEDGRKDQDDKDQDGTDRDEADHHEGVATQEEFLASGVLSSGGER